MWEGGVQKEQHLALAEDIKKKNRRFGIIISKKNFIHSAYTRYPWFLDILGAMLEVLFGLDKQDQNRLSSTLTADSACLYALHNLYQKEATMATSNWTKRQTPMQYNMAPQQSTRCNATYEMLARCVLLSNKLIQQTKMTIIHQNANAKKKYIVNHC